MASVPRPEHTRTAIPCTSPDDQRDPLVLAERAKRLAAFLEDDGRFDLAQAAQNLAHAIAGLTVRPVS
jgi:hypothetical protein